MASFKRIRFFECDQIEDAQAAQAKNQQTAGAAKGRGKEEAKSIDPKDRTI